MQIVKLLLMYPEIAGVGLKKIKLFYLPPKDSHLVI